MKELITMTPRELSRYEIIKRLINKEIDGTEASKQMFLSVRQVKNVKARVRKQGARGVIHKSRGQPSNRRMPDEKIKQAEQRVRDKYHDFGPTFAAEKLEEKHGIKIGKETLRQLMINWGLWEAKPRKNNKEYRSWRPRKEQYGQMVQFDGSYHQWFEQRAPECCLLASIDDATGKITGLRFTSHEATLTVFSFWKEYLLKHGKPISIYLDRFSAYKKNHKTIFDDPNCLTQFERAMKELNIEPITAYSPQAKGRAERLFCTLQDRLIKELRLINISTIKEANQFVEKIFISRFNKRFAYPPQKKGNLHRKLTRLDKRNLDSVFSVQNTRIVNNDFTVRYQSRWFQLDEIQPCLVLRKDKVVIEERPDRSIFISLKNKHLNFKELPKRPERIKMRVTALSGSKTPWKPPANHPWRRPFLIKKSKAKDLIPVN